MVGLVGLLFVGLLVCQVVITAPRVGLGEGGLGPDYLFGRPKGQVVL